MSHKSTSEYIAVKRKKYLCTSRAKKSQILDEVQETTGFTRKYVTNLLNGNIRYRARKGRGKTYGAVCYNKGHSIQNRDPCKEIAGLDVTTNCSKP